MKKNEFPISELLILALGELLVGLLVVGGYLLAELIFDSVEFSYKVITGVLLGSLVAIFNYLFLVISVNRAINRFLELRGTAEMDEEAAKKFASEHSGAIQSKIALSYIIRTVSMLAALVIALLLDFFAPVATIIPLLAFRPIITIGEIVRVKLSSKGTAPVIADFTDISDSVSENELIDSEPTNEKESDD